MLAVGTLIIRASIIGISGKILISNRTKELFSYIPAAILPAFITPAVFFHQGKLSWIFGKERFLVMILATLVCYYSRSTLLTIGFGLVSLYIITQV